MSDFGKSYDLDNLASESTDELWEMNHSTEYTGVSMLQQKDKSTLRVTGLTKQYRIFKVWTEHVFFFS